MWSILQNLSKAVQKIIPVPIIKESTLHDVLQGSRSLPATCPLVP
jgi:hypothetical protein